MPESIPWILTALSMIGAALNMAKLPSGQMVWVVSNIGWVVVFYLGGNHPATALFCFYLATSIIGVFWWKRRTRADDQDKAIPGKIKVLGEMIRQELQ